MGPAPAQAGPDSPLASAPELVLAPAPATVPALST
jgi:hypothetical protein